MTSQEVLEAVSAVLEKHRGQCAGADAEIALRYAVNATRWAWKATTDGAETGPFLDVLVDALRDAARLYREDRDDDDGIGFATLRELIRDLGARLGVELAPERNVASAPSMLSGYGMHRWSPQYFREQFTALPPELRPAFIERASRHAAFVAGLVPTAMDHTWFLAWCWALQGDWERAAKLVRLALERGAVLLEAAASSPGTFESMLYDAHRLSEALATQAFEGGASAELASELRDAFVLITERRRG